MQNFKKLSVPLLLRQEKMIKALRDELDGLKSKGNIQGELVSFWGRNFDGVLEGCRGYVEMARELCRSCECFAREGTLGRTVAEFRRAQEQRAAEANGGLEEIARRVLGGVRLVQTGAGGVRS